VAHDCGLLPLALGMAGKLAKEQPLEPSSWRAVHEKVHKKRTKFRQMENGKLFSTIDTSLCDLPLTQQEYLQLLAVLASGVVAPTDMLANLWDQVRTCLHICQNVFLSRLWTRLRGIYQWSSRHTGCREIHMFCSPPYRYPWCFLFCLPSHISPRKYGLRWLY